MMKNKKAMAGIPFSRLPVGAQILAFLGLGLFALAMFAISLYMLYNQLF